MAFLDDDAEAAPDWLERLAAMYDDPDVLAVGGRVEPRWEAGRPGYFAEELDWIVGCTYRGMPKVAAEVRNVIGANMSFRAEVLDRVGGFNPSLGRQDGLPLGCEETELCIRAVMGAPGLPGRLRTRGPGAPPRSRRARQPAIHAGPLLVRRYFQGPGQPGRGPQAGALGPERRYVRQVLPRAVFAGIRGWIRGKDPAGLSRAGAIIAVLASTASGYLRGRRLPAGSLPAEPSLVPQDELWREVQ